MNKEPHILDDIDGDLDEIEAIERMQIRVRAFQNIRERIRAEKSSFAAIGRELGKSGSFIGSCLNGDYPWTNAHGLPKYLYEYLINRRYATEKEITWMRPATSAELRKGAA